jgi:pimeloyl-ACP methyl ester carboxylesterase
MGCSRPFLPSTRTLEPAAGAFDFEHVARHELLLDTRRQQRLERAEAIARQRAGDGVPVRGVRPKRALAEAGRMEGPWARRSRRSRAASTPARLCCSRRGPGGKLAVVIKLAGRFIAAHLAIVVGLAACEGETTPRDTQRATFTEGPCLLQGLDGAGRARFCGVVTTEQARFAVPERLPAQLSGIELYVEHLPGTGAEPPILFLTGGPGMSLEGYAALGALQKLALESSRGVILLEQRGNALSTNGLVCVEGASPSACREALVAGGIVPEAFTSRESADDVTDGLDALGYERAVLFGHSYGSGLALRVAQHHPERVAALVLEGVSAPDLREPFDVFAHLVSMLDGFGSWHRGRCATDPSCSETYPDGLDPASDGPKVGQLLQGQGLTVPLTPKLGFDEATFALWAKVGLANYTGMLLFSELVHAVARSTPEDRSPLDALLVRVGGGDLEKGATALEGYVAALRGASAAEPSATVKTCFDLGTIGTDPACAAFDGAVYPDEALAFSLSTDLPTLWLQGPLDTQTPISQADPLRARFSALTEALFAPCLGHFSYLDGESCSDEVLQSFLATPGAPLPSCVEKVCDAKPLLTSLAK